MKKKHFDKIFYEIPQHIQTLSQSIYNTAVKYYGKNLRYEVGSICDNNTVIVHHKNE